MLSGASAFAHDLYGQIFKKGKVTEKEQMVAARSASIAVSVISIVLALGAQNMNVAFLVSLAFCIAASANLPVIIYTIYWKKFTTTGALAAIVTGLVTALVLVLLSPNLWAADGSMLFTGEPLFPLTNPALVSVPAGFIGGFIGTLVGQRADAKKYAEVDVKATVGLK